MFEALVLIFVEFSLFIGILYTLSTGTRKPLFGVSVVCKVVSKRKSDNKWPCSAFILSSSIVGHFLLSYFPLLLAIFGQHFKLPKETIHKRRTYFGSQLQRNQSMVISLHYFYNHGREETSGRKGIVKERVSLHSIQEAEGKNQESGLQYCLRSKCLAIHCLH